MQTAPLRGSHLSLQQARLWAFQQDNQAYRAQCAILLEGQLNRKALQYSLQHLVDQHEILRTYFHLLSSMDVPIQAIASSARLEITEYSIEEISPSEQVKWLEELFAIAQMEPFDLTSSHLLHISLVDLSSQRHLLLITLPGLCADATTLKLFVAELSQTYTSYLQPEEPAEEPLQYIDVATWQKEILAEEDAEEQQAYWRKIELSQLSTLRLPFESQDRGTQGKDFVPDVFHSALTQELAAQATLLAQDYHVSLSTIFLLCWQILLGRLTDEADLTVGLVCDGRYYEELAAACGLYSSVIPLKTHLGNERQFSQVMLQVHKAVEQAKKLQLYFVWDKPLPGHEATYFPLSFEFETWPDTFPAKDMSFSLYKHFSCIERFALKLNLLQVGGTLSLALHYDAQRFSVAFMKHLSNSLLALLECAIAHPQTHLKDLDLLSPVEQQRLLEDFQGPVREIPRQSFHQVFEAVVERFPYQVAIVCGAEQLTYNQLNSRANQLAHWLVRQGVSANTLVGLCMERSATMLVGLLGILKAGGAYVPLDPEHPPARLAYQLKDMGTSLVITQQNLLERLPEWEGQYLCLDYPSTSLSDENSTNPEIASGQSDLAYVIYTSGSTGMPKGVMIRQQSVSNYTYFMQGLIAKEQGLQFATVSTLAADLGNTVIFCALASGGCLHVLPYEMVTDGEAFANYLIERPIDVLKIVPSHLNALLATTAKNVLPGRSLICGGEVFSWALLGRLQEMRSSCEIFNHYGPTEATIGMLVNSLGVQAQQHERLQMHTTTLVPLGRPIFNTEALILDAKLRLVPVGVTGELYIGGRGLAAGYLNQPEQTRERFIEHPFQDGKEARIYKTGDRARYTPDAQIEFVGRVDNQIKLRGYRIELEEIETILGQHPQVLGNVILVRQDAAGEQRLVAYVVPRGKLALASAELQRYLQERLPGYMVPSSFMLSEAFPLTPNGKIDRHRLPTEVESQRVVQSPFIAPRTPIEEILVVIWEDILAISPVGIHDNFFHLGGHSLMATQVISRFRSVLGVEIPIRDLFRAPTVAGIAEMIEQVLRRDHPQVPPILPVARTEELPLSFAQQRLWLLDQLGGGAAYNQPQIMRMQGKLHVAFLMRSLTDLVKRHEILHTAFHTRRGHPIQVIEPFQALPVKLIDLSALEEQEVKVHQLAEEEALRPFDLSHGPLVRAILVRLAQQEHILLITMHHIVSDGWSNSIALHDIAAFYNAYVEGKPAELPALPLQYADFAVWQREWLQGEVLETQLHYWKNQLADGVPLNMQTDRPRSNDQSFQSAHQDLWLSPALSEALKQLSQREGVTLFMTLLAAFQTLLFRYSGEVDIAVGSPIANRNRAEIEDLIGFFVNTLVMRTNFAGNPTFQHVLRQVREVALGAYTYQDMPFEKLVEELQPERDLSRSPLFQTVFVLQNVPALKDTLSGLTVTTGEGETSVARVDLHMSVMDSEQGLLTSLEYNTHLFHSITIERFLKHWKRLLEAVLLQPEQHVANFLLLTEAERQQILLQWNATDIDYPRNQCSHQFFEAPVLRTPDAIAVTDEKQAITYAELDQRANQLAHHLQEQGLKPEVLVAVGLERCVELVISILGILKAGGAYLPLDPAYPAERLSFMVVDAQVEILLTKQDLVDRLPQVPQVIFLDTDWPVIAHKSRQKGESHVTARNLAYVIYTSGSTGTPKGVMIAHQGMGNLGQSQSQAFGVQPGSRVLQFASLSFDASISELVMTLLAGATLCLFPAASLFPGPDLLHVLRQYQITHVTLPPSALRVLPVEPLPALQTLIVASETCPQDVLMPWVGQRVIFNAYGPTEATVCATLARVEEHVLPNIGRPISNTRIYICDQYLQPVPVGMVGEIYISGIGLARGYLRRPEWTAERFVPNPFGLESGQRLYKTGDRGRYQPDGSIDFLGRSDEQIKLRGYRIEPGEIEARLQCYPGIHTCAVAMREEHPGDKRLVAYLVEDGSVRVRVQDLRDFLLETLPEYMVPASFMLLDRLPLLPNGKVNRRAFPTPVQSDLEHSDNIATPRSKLEQILVEQWEQILEVQPIGIDENFFGLGGHSLLGAQLFAHLQAILQIQVPLQVLFEAPTIAQLAQWIEECVAAEQKDTMPLLVPVSRADRLPLSFAQQGLWFFDQLEPESAAYNIPSAVQLSGKLEVRALEQSLDEIVRRHEILQTTFSVVDGQVVQIVHPTSTFRLTCEDLSGLASQRRQDEVQRLAEDEGLRPFDLVHGPLLRATLLCLGEHEHILLLTMHHIISDGSSIQILVHELTTLYNAFVEGKPSPLPALPIQYADFASWQRKWLQGEVLEAQLAYWQKQLAAIPLLDLPTDHPRPLLQSYQGSRQTTLLPLSLSKELKELSQREDVTLFMTLLAAFQVLLFRYTGQTDIVVGTPTANRNRIEIEKLIGFFVNTLVMRTDLSGCSGFLDVLERVRTMTLGAYEHQQVPFEKVVEMLQPGRDVTHSPLFQVMFVLQNALQPPEVVTGLTVTDLDRENNVVKFDLTMIIADTEQGLQVSLMYNADLFEASRMARLLGHWQALLEAIVLNPQQSITTLPLLTQAEREALLNEWNKTDFPYTRDLCLHHLFEQKALQMPDALAIVYNENCLSYGELNRRADQVARYLHSLAVEPEMRIGLCLERSLLLPIGILGILKAGCAYVPLDPTYPKQRLQFMIEDAQLAIVLTQHQFCGEFGQSQTKVIDLDISLALGKKEQEQRLASGVTSANLAYIIYTSGSTGKPKGVQISHTSVVSLIEDMTVRLEVQQRMHLLQFASFNFDISVADMFTAWRSGAVLYLPSQEITESGPDLVHFMREQEISLCSLPSAVLANMPTADLPSLEIIRTGGDTWSQTKLGHWARGRRLFNEYGPTEATICNTTDECFANGQPPSIGRPVANTQVYLVDADLQLVPVGIPGELLIGGVGLARGYLQQPDLTAERFIPNPYGEVPGARLYKTGDIACYSEDGTITFLGRRDEQVKIRGFRIELTEIERVLEQHPALQRCVVSTHEDQRGDKRLVAYLVSKERTAPSTRALREYLLALLPEHMVPAYFVLLEALPLLPNGKLDRRGLPQPDAIETGTDKSSAVEPGSPIEMLLADAWCDVLERDSISIHDNFFEIGGHSLLATQLISRIRPLLKVGLPLRSLFEAPTVASLAKYIERLMRGKQGYSESMAPLVPVARQDELPLSFAQQRLWFLDQLEPGNSFYNIPLAMRLEGTLNVEVLQRSFGEIIRRHEILRTTFSAQAEQVFQSIKCEEEFSIQILDLSSFLLEERAIEIWHQIKEQAELQFDLAHGPLLGIKLLRIHEQEHILLLTLHHIIADGWSMGVLMRELSILYQAFMQGKPSPLVDLPIQYADFAVWQRQQLQGEALEDQVNYWSKQLAGRSPLALPTDYPRPIIQSYHGARQVLLLPISLGTALKKLSQAEGATLYMTLLAAFQVLLARYTGQTDIVVGSPIANRNHVEIEGLIGCFVNTLVLRTNLAGSLTFQQVLARVREVTLGAYAYQDLPFEKLVEALQPERDLSRSPLFQVMFELQNMPMPDEDIGYMSIVPLEHENAVAKFDLTLSVIDIPQGLECRIEYNTDLFKAATIRRLLEHWQNLLEALINNPGYALGNLPLLTEAEQQQRLIEWNNTRTEFAYACVHQLFERQALHNSEAIALTYKNEHLTYGALNRQANAIARRLQAMGVGPEVAVGLCVEHSLEMIGALLGIFKAGGVYVPLDPGYPKERLALLVQDTQMAVVLTQRHLSFALPAQIACLYMDWNILLEKEERAVESAVGPEHAAYIIYTSGSTGRPKGVMVNHLALVNDFMAWMQAYPLQIAGTSQLQLASISFDVFLGEVTRALCSGGRLVLCPPHMRLAADELYTLMYEEQVACADFVPDLLKQLTLYLQATQQKLDFMQLLIVGSDVWTGDDYQQFRRSVGAQTHIINAYGLTETTIDGLYFEGNAEEVALGSNIPLGGPFANSTAYILDQQGQLAPINVLGELYIGGVGVARGYLNRPDLTAERFLPDPFSATPGARLYRTGDLVRYLSTGTIDFLGRMDHQIKIRGFRLEPGEIEGSLRSYPGLQDCVIAAIQLSNGENQLAAYMIMENSSPPSRTELRRYLLETLPEYMLPSHFIILDRFPMLLNGKIDYKALPEAGIASIVAGEPSALPRSPIEEVLVGIWKEILGVDHIGIYDNFFALGGHSLLATRVISRIRTVLQLAIPLRVIFETPSIYGLAGYAENLLQGEYGITMPPIVTMSRERELPLSFAQQRLWFLDQLEPESTAYIIPVAVGLHGRLNIVALEKSFIAVVRRHESLRTTFRSIGGQAFQIVHEPEPFSIHYTDLCTLPWEERKRESQQMIEEEALSPFDLEQGPLLRVKLLCLAEEEHILLLTMHHIISDGWSSNILVREVTTLYYAFCAGQPAALPALPIQYADFAAWQRQWLQGENLDVQLRYWQHQLRDLAPLSLPTDYPRPAIQTFHGSYQDCWLPALLRDELKRMSQREGVTLFMTLLAAFQTLLARYSGQADIAVGSPIANRNRVEIEGVIGFFVNTLVMRTDLSGNPAFLQVLKRVREVALGAYTHQDIPFEKLVEVLQPERKSSHSPLFQVMFSLQQPDELPVAQAGINVTSMESVSHSSKFDLNLTILDEKEGLHCVLGYNTDLFDAQTMQRWLAYWTTFLNAIVSDPAQPISELAVLPEEERQRVLVTWNATGVDYPAELCLHSLFEAQVERVPEAIAVVFYDEQICYRELNRLANALARQLQAVGVGPEVVVGICVERSVQMAVAVIGVLKAGGAYLPLDPEYPQERLMFMMEEAQIGLLLTQEQLKPSVPATHTPVMCLDLVPALNMAIYSPVYDLNVTSKVTAQNMAYIIYTSGSTGRPKGAMNTHQGMSNRLLWGQTTYPLDETDRFLHEASFSFDGAVWELLWPLMAGAAVVLTRPGGQRDSQYLTALMATQNVSVARLGPSLLSALLAEPETRSCSHLRHIFCGGEVLPTDLENRLKQVLPLVRLHNVYGPAEAAANTTAWECSQEHMPSVVPIGYPIANVQVYLLDTALQPVPIGVTGEIYIGGCGVGRGYISRPDLTAQQFIPHPFSIQPGARLYKTGDLARYRSDGALMFVERLDSQVKLRGYRIELGEIETVLLTHPAIQDVVVMVKGRSEEHKRVVAYLVAEGKAVPENLELQQHLQKRLPEYMLPSAWIWLEHLPITPNGKVYRAALPEPDEGAITRTESYRGPRRPIEEVLVGIWQNLLDVRPIGIYDSFFVLGGHSLLATQLIARVRALFNVEVPLRSLFETQTIAALAEQIEAILRGAPGVIAPPIATISRESMLPLSFAQQRIWFLDRLEPGNSAYNIPVAIRLYGKLNLSALKESMDEVVRRHETLRTVFRVVKDELNQVIKPTRHSSLQYIDLRAVGSGTREAELRRLVGEEGQLSFDLAQGPLLRVKLVGLAEEEHALLLTMHHIISDGWSSKLLVQEMSTLYRTFCAGQPAELPALPIQYADFAAWQRQWLQGEILQEQLRYWQHQLHDMAPLMLPMDHPRPLIQRYRGTHLSMSYPLWLSDSLTQLSQQEGVTLFMTLLAAFQILLARYCGQTDIAVGTSIANRSQLETEALIGFFVNMLVLRTDLAGNPTFLHALERVREIALGAYTHQDVPFEKLVETLQPVRDLSRPPLFQVLFELHNAEDAVEELPGIVISDLNNDNFTAKFDLSLSMSPTRQGLQCSVEYNTDLFEHATIQRFLEHWQTLLVAVVRDPMQRIDEISLLTETERQQILRAWNATGRSYPDQVCYAQLFEAQVERAANSVAVRYAGQEMTYQELNRRANQLAHWLRAHSVRPEALVGIYMQRSIEMVVAILGIFKVGAAYVPLDPAYPASRLAFILEDTHISAIIVQPAYLPLVSERSVPLLSLEPGWQVISKYSEENPTNQQHVNNLAYVIYTSGSTGRPKGVMITQAGMLNHLFAKIEYLKLSDTDVIAQTASHCFDISVWQLFAIFLVGGQVEILADEIAHDPERLLVQVAAQKISVLEIVPSLLRILLDQIERQEAVLSRKPALRRLVVTGEALPFDLCRRWLELYPSIPLVNAYGPTECSDDVTHFTVESTLMAKRVSTPIGKAISNTQLYILNDRLSPMPIGVPGQLYIGGAGVGRGYFNAPDQSAAVFIPDPFTSRVGTRLYRTGDLARYLDDGNIEFLGRIDDQVKIRGFRIELGEITTTLNKHAAVRESVVINRETSSGDSYLVAYIVEREQAVGLISQLRTSLQENLPAYMIPSYFIVLDSLPLTANGKIDYQALPLPETGKMSLEQNVAPRSPIEEILLNLWQEVLGVSSVGIYDNFFTLGGHSLLATQVISRIRTVLQVELPLRSLFEAPTVVELSVLVERTLRAGQGIEVLPILPASREGELPLSFAQQRLWFLDQLKPGSSVYNILLAVKLDGKLDVKALTQSLNEVVRRHESLRTIFPASTGEPVQFIMSFEPFCLPLEDLSGLVLREDDVIVEQLIEEESQQPFNLARGPLFRPILLRLNPSQHILVLTLHHIISDGWSMGVLIHELTTLYTAFVAGERAFLPDLALQYADYAVWQRQWLQGKVLENEQHYWKQQLAGDIPALNLPTDHLRLPVQTFHGANLDVQFSLELCQKMKLVCQQEGLTLFMLLLATFQIQLARYTEQTDIVVGTDIANRDRSEIEGLIGFFVNQLVLRTNLSGNPTLREVLQRVYTSAMGAYTHQDFPFDKLVEVVNPERNLQHTPLFQVKIILQNITQVTGSHPDLAITTLAPNRFTAQFDLLLVFEETAGEIKGHFIYNTDLFEISTMKRLSEHFMVVLDTMVTNLDIRLDAFEMLTVEERKEKLEREQEREKAKLNKFRSIKPKPVVLPTDEQ